jgi:hypothetical protein
MTDQLIGLFAEDDNRRATRRNPRKGRRRKHS